MKIYSLSQGKPGSTELVKPSSIQRFFSLCFCLLFLVLVQTANAEIQSANLYWPTPDSLKYVSAIMEKKALFIAASDVQDQLPISIVSDPETGVFVLRTTLSCRNVYVADSSEVRMDGSSAFIHLLAIADVLGCDLKIKRRREAFFSCNSGYPTQQPGSNVGDIAPGFYLNATPDSLLSLSNLLTQGPVVVAFVRSGEWDPASKILLQGLQSRSDSLRSGGFEIVAVHGYEPRTGMKWAKDLKLTFAQLSDNLSAVMRGYDVFERGHHPFPALFVIDRNGIIRYREVFTDPMAAPDVEKMMEAIRQMKN